MSTAFNMKNKLFQKRFLKRFFMLPKNRFHNYVKPLLWMQLPHSIIHLFSVHKCIWDLPCFDWSAYIFMKQWVWPTCYFSVTRIGGFTLCIPCVNTVHNSERNPPISGLISFTLNESFNGFHTSSSHLSSQRLERRMRTPKPTPTAAYCTHVQG